LKTAVTDIAAKFLLDDVSGASVPASRLRGILERIDAHKPLSPLQEEFLRQRDHHSLLQFAHGDIELDEFRIRAKQERATRSAKREAEARLEASENARRAEITNRKNNALFAHQKKKMEQRKKLRELPDFFDLPFIQPEDLRRVNRILQSVVDGKPLGKEDLLWIAKKDGEYWTDSLRKAHHKILAENLRDDWNRIADAWCAVNACGHWRKAECPREGVAIVKAALEQAEEPKIRSALLTTGGGALRDLKRFFVPH